MPTKKTVTSTPAEFRRRALACAGAVEGAHMGTADFRVHGKIFATLGSPDPAWGMVKLSAQDQAMRIDAEPAAFKPATGAWGRAGCTLVKLDAVDAVTLESAIRAAWRNVPAKKPPAKKKRS
ncbi:MmcQ/YjbR family DNA-binding protein [Roseiterribacter gracilis]|uniref:Uncharacterized protein n=1 Tax=Roseiterribacter gracilis TaxID=2812848 RepID=A0A8S8XD57_9PROT|nr:hypothetical protein TMPK1_20480 [Rhodospirillales bacterium TMPK1]